MSSFATYTNIDALGRLWALRPDSIDDPQGNAEWAEAWRFLMRDTDLALDDSSEQIQALIRAQDELAVRLVSSGLGRVYASDTPRPAERWRVHIGSTKQPSTGMLSAPPEGAASCLARALRPDSLTLQTGRKIPPAIAAFQIPTPGFIVVDPYALSSGPKGLKDSVSALLAALIPVSQQGPVAVMLVCGSVNREKKRVVEGQCP